MFGLDPDIQVAMESMFDLDPRVALRSPEDDVFGVVEDDFFCLLCSDATLCVC